LAGQITRTTPLRRMILHFSQIFLMDALTFIVLPLAVIASLRDASLRDLRNNRASLRIALGALDTHSIAGLHRRRNSSELLGDVRRQLFSVLQSHSHHGAGQKLDDRGFERLSLFAI
jgi:hypothetical protein